MTICKWCRTPIFKKIPNPFPGGTQQQPGPMYRWWHKANAQGVESINCNNHDLNSHVAEPADDSNEIQEKYAGTSDDEWVNLDD